MSENTGLNPEMLLTQDGPSFLGLEVERLRKSPEAIQLLIDHYHSQESEADALGERELVECLKVMESRRAVLERWRDDLLKRRGDRSVPADALDARRYRRLQILGCAVMGSPELAKGFVSRFSNLDAIVDADLNAHPSRGEAAVDLQTQAERGGDFPSGGSDGGSSDGSLGMRRTLERILEINPLESATKEDLSLAIGEIRKQAQAALSIGQLALAEASAIEHCWIILRRAGYIPEVKVPTPNTAEGTEGMLRELLQLYPMADITVVQLACGGQLWVEDGRQALQMGEALRVAAEDSRLESALQENQETIDRQNSRPGWDRSL